MKKSPFGYVYVCQSSFRINWWGFKRESEVQGHSGVVNCTSIALVNISFILEQFYTEIFTLKMSLL